MITYIVYMYTIKKEEQQQEKEEQVISSITMRSRIRKQSDILATEMKIRRYLKSKNIDNVKNITILNWKDIEP